MDQGCVHLGELSSAGGILGKPPDADVCTDCVAIGGRWLHLRRCLECGHVGCCDSSPNHHATVHHNATGHPVIQSFEPGEEWVWCFDDELVVELDDLPPSPAHP